MQQTHEVRSANTRSCRLHKRGEHTRTVRGTVAVYAKA